MTSSNKSTGGQPRGHRATRHHRTLSCCCCRLVSLSLLAACLGLSLALAAQAAAAETPVLSSRAAFLRAQRASRQLHQAPQANTTAPSSTTSTTSAPPAAAAAASSATSPSSTSTTTSTTSSTSSTTSAPPPTSPKQASSTATSLSASSSRPRQALAGSPLLAAGRPTTRDESQPARASTGSNRTTRTADVFQNGDGYNIFVTNTCEREQMHVKIITSRDFNGVIHTRNQRQKPLCTVEGNGGTEYSLDISHALNPADPNYCGVIKARRESPDDKDLLSVVLAVRFHRNIELSDDKFFLLNCTNRCRKPDCSTPTPTPATSNNNNKLLLANDQRGRIIADEIPDGGERETVTSRPGDQDRRNLANGGDDECTIWKFPWVITLLWCLGILLLAMIISHCIMCSSLMCKCVKTEVEEREPSVYEDDHDDDHETDDEDKLYNRKNHPMRIDYDNRDIYKTSNNYEPYSLDSEAQQQATADQRRARKAKQTRR